jgi:hypothetical protein
MLSPGVTADEGQSQCPSLALAGICLFKFDQCSGDLGAMVAGGAAWGTAGGERHVMCGFCAALVGIARGSRPPRGRWSRGLSVPEGTEELRDGGPGCQESWKRSGG